MSKELKNRISCYVRVDHDLVNFSSCDIDNFKDYRVFLISGKFGQSDFQRIYHTTSKKNIELLIDGETISTVARRRKFLKIFPDRHFIFLHLQEQKEEKIIWQLLV